MPLESTPPNNTDSAKPVCFIIMPISDTIGYSPGHFKRVYEYIIKPACEQAGFNPIRADDIKGTNVIVIDILKRIINSDMAICDLSAKNPNVFYELGIRQSFDLPVTLIKDDLTERIFDIQGFRDVEYPNTLRIDEVGNAIDLIANSIRETYENKGKDVNSIVELLGLSKAALKEPVTLSNETSVILNAISDLKDRVNSIKESKIELAVPVSNEKLNLDLSENINWQQVEINRYEIGDRVLHPKFGQGDVTNIDNVGTEIKATIRFDSVGEKILLLNFAGGRMKKYIRP